ncbi:MAG: DUF1194 domain-containing protein [Rhodospirillales bacterium]
MSLRQFSSLFTVFALWLVAFGLTAPRLAAQEAVDTALVLAVDASGSIDPQEFSLQREGIAAAATSPDFLDVIRFGQQGRVALAYVEWGGPGTARTQVDWMFVQDTESAEAFAAAVLSAPRSPQSYNAIGDAIVWSQALLEACPCVAGRRVIDISGDNPDNRSLVSAPVARDGAVAAGIVINALAILQDSFVGSSGKPWLVETYEATVIGGPGAFVMTAASRRDFERALLDKMILEIAAGPRALEAARALLAGRRIEASHP